MQYLIAFCSRLEAANNDSTATPDMTSLLPVASFKRKTTKILRPEKSFGQFLETPWTRLHTLAPSSRRAVDIYISTGNDVTNYFRSAANCINVFILGHLGGRDFSITVHSISKGLQFWKGWCVIQLLHFLVYNSLDIFCHRIRGLWADGNAFWVS